MASVRLTEITVVTNSRPMVEYKENTLGVVVQRVFDETQQENTDSTFAGS